MYRHKSIGKQSLMPGHEREEILQVVRRSYILAHRKQCDYIQNI